MTLHDFDLSTRKLRSLFKNNGGGAFLGLSVSPDGRYVLYLELDEYRSEIMLVQNFDYESSRISSPSQLM